MPLKIRTSSILNILTVSGNQIVKFELRRVFASLELPGFRKHLTKVAFARGLANKMAKRLTCFLISFQKEN